MTSHASNKLLFAFFAAAAAMFSWLAGFEAYSWWLMGHDKATVQATVTSARFHPCTGRGCLGIHHPYQVRYRFSPPGSDRTYMYTGQWLLSEMWVRVPESVYLLAQRSNMIDVAYAPSDPRVNRPAADPTKPAYEWIGFGAFAILSFGVGWYLLNTPDNAPKRNRSSA